MVQLYTREVGETTLDRRSPDREHGSGPARRRDQHGDDLAVVRHRDRLACLHVAQYRAAVVAQLAVRDRPAHVPPPVATVALPPGGPPRSPGRGTAGCAPGPGLPAPDPVGPTPARGRRRGSTPGRTPALRTPSRAWP